MVKLVHINKVGPTGDLYVLREFHAPVSPDQGLPGGGTYPDQGLPTIPGVPDNTLPTTPPPTVMPGATLVMVRTSDGKWHWAAIPPGQPTPPLLPDNTLPGGGAHPDQGLPPGAPPRPSQGLPPTPTPKS